MSMSKANREKLDRVKAARARYSYDGFMRWLHGFVKDHPALPSDVLRAILAVKHGTNQ